MKSKASSTIPPLPSRIPSVAALRRKTERIYRLVNKSRLVKIGEAIGESSLAPLMIRLTDKEIPARSLVVVQKYLMTSWLKAVPKNDDDLYRMCWRLASMILKPVLHDGFPVTDCEPVAVHWAGSTLTEVSACLHSSFHGDQVERAYRVTAGIWYGPLAGESIRYVADGEKIRLLWYLLVSRNHVPATKFSLQHHSQLAGMQAMVCVESVDGILKVLRWEVLPSQQQYNRSLCRRRYLEYRKCPFHYDHECFECPLGTDRCRLAVRPDTLKRGQCLRCKTGNTFCRPDTGWCITCESKRIVS